MTPEKWKQRHERHDILAREQQCRRWELSLKMSHRETDALTVVVQEKPARSPELDVEFHVWIAGGSLSDGHDIRIVGSAEEAHALAMSELGKALGESL